MSAALKSTAESNRLASMDAYRGFVMICLAANGFGLFKASKNFPESPLWQTIGVQFEHVPWVGCAFWDLIQPSFMFLVGVALPYSYSRREASGESSGNLLKHVLGRSLILVLLGIFLSSMGKPTTDFTFMNVLTQIGLGYPFLFLFRNRKFAVQLVAAIAILAGYWGWFASTPVVQIEDKKQHHLPEDWVLLEGFEGHWQKHENAAAYVDRWLLNVFPPATAPAQSTAAAQATSAESAPADASAPENQDKQPGTTTPALFDNVVRCMKRLVTRPEPYVFNGGGYQTLNFIPALVTMLFGLMTGEFIRRNSNNRGKTFGLLLVSGMVLLGLGYGWSALGYCPLVKRIWTPSWTLFSTGWTLLMLSGFFGIIDGLGWKAWSFPLIVAGMNSMVLYMSGQLLRGWTSALLKRHINENLFNVLGEKLAPIVEANLVLLSFWLFVYWLYRQRIFVRI